MAVVIVAHSARRPSLTLAQPFMLPFLAHLQRIKLRGLSRPAAPPCAETLKKQFQLVKQRVSQNYT